MTKADKLRNPFEIEGKIDEIVKYIKPLGSLCAPILHCVSAEGGGYGLFELMSNLVFHST